MTRWTIIIGSLAALIACGGSDFQSMPNGSGGDGNAGTGESGGASAGRGNAGRGGSGTAGAAEFGGMDAGSGGEPDPAGSGGQPSGGRAGAGGSSGGSAGGSQAGSGGLALGGGAGTSNCTELWNAYRTEYDLARECDPDAMVRQCSQQYTLNDSCGCPMPAVGTSPHYETAQEKYAAYVTAGCAGLCERVCVIGVDPTCGAEPNGSGHSCQW